MAKKTSFPKQIVVKRERPANDDPYLYVVEEVTAQSTEDGESVAIYELKEVKRVRQTVELE